MVENITVTATKKTPPTSDLSVYVNGKILNRFESFSVSHSLDTVPMSFSIQYAYNEGDNSEPLNFLSTTTTSDTSDYGLLTAGQKVEIYLEKQKVITGYIDSTSESTSYEQHQLSIDGRSKTSVIVDSTTDQPPGLLPTALVSLADVADYMFSGFGISTKDNTNSETKYPIAGYAQIDLTTKPYDYVAMLAQYEGKLLYDNEYGQMVIDNVPTGNSSKTKITDKNSTFEDIVNYKTTLGRYRNYRTVINAYGGPAGIDKSLIQDVSASDPAPNELPPGKNLTIVSQMMYPENGDVNGLREFQQSLIQYTANVNWGRGQTITATAAGFLNPLTQKLWRINTIVSLDFQVPQIQGDYVIQSVTYYFDQYAGRRTDLVFVRREALLQQPITITPTIAGVNDPNNLQTDSDDGSIKDQTDKKTQKLNVPDDPPANAKPVGDS